MYNLLDYKVEDGIATVTLRHEETMNAFTAEMAQELNSVATDLMTRRDVKVVLVDSSLSNFSIGMPDEEASEYTYQTIQFVTEAIRKWTLLPYPIMMAIQGHCNSLAFSFATIADIRICASNAIFSMPEITRGLVPAGGITQRLPRLIGKGPAMMILLGSQIVSADEALQLGLTTKVVEPQQLAEVALTEARQLSHLSTLSLQYTKECLLRGSELSFQQGLRLELDVYMTLQTSQDRMEGVEAFLQKRTPNFVGE